MRAPPLLLATALGAVLRRTIVSPAAAEIMLLLGTKPRPNQVMSDSSVAFALHFD